MKDTEISLRRSMSIQFRQRVFILLGAMTASALGCGQAPPPQFQLNPVAMVSKETSDAYQQEIANVLGGLFGTPDEPFALPEAELDQKLLNLAAGQAWTDPNRVSRGLYRRHCVHCHGITGDGRGPTAKFLNPYPRDYRQGIFKFKSTRNPAKPTDVDLHRILVNGVPGTSMPSFSSLPESELAALVEYVKYLAIRGEMEIRLAQYVFDELGEEEVEGEDGEVKIERLALDPTADPDQAQAVKDILTEVVAPWQEAGDMVVNPEEDALPEDERSPEEIAESVAKGRELFYSTKANCFSCHGPTGLGDGQQTDFDVWNKEQNAFKVANEEQAESLEDRRKEELDEEGEADLERDEELLAQREAVEATFYPIRNAIPRNLRKGIYRGGRRRIDIFHRVHQGIAGTPMPGLGAASEGAEGTLSEAEIWNIVDYVLSLPYEPISNPQPQLTVNPQEITK
jgi:mono/diheme cytochrome c family protein